MRIVLLFNFLLFVFFSQILTIYQRRYNWYEISHLLFFEDKQIFAEINFG